MTCTDLYFSFALSAPFSFSFLPVSLELAGLAHVLQLVLTPVRCMVDVLPQVEKNGNRLDVFWKVETVFYLVLLVNFSVGQLRENPILTPKSL